VAYVEGLCAAARGVPARVPLGELHPDAVVHHGERKRIHDAVRMATYKAETALARLLGPHYPRADDEARSLLREAMRSPADLQIVGDELHVRINPLSAPRGSRAIAALCEDLNSTDTAYPGTERVFRYSVKDRPVKNRKGDRNPWHAQPDEETTEAGPAPPPEPEPAAA